jgi:hypothetical protein
MINTLFRVLADLGPAAGQAALFLAVFFALVVAVFVRHVGEVLRAVLDERDLDRQRILRQVLRDLLELFRRGRGT